MAAWTFMVAILAIIVCQVWIILIGFESNSELGCLLIALGPAMSLIFFLQNPRRTALPFAIMCAGFVVAWQSFFAMDWHI